MWTCVDVVTPPRPPKFTKCTPCTKFTRLVNFVKRCKLSTKFIVNWIYFFQYSREKFNDISHNKRVVFKGMTSFLYMFYTWYHALVSNFQLQTFESPWCCIIHPFWEWISRSDTISRINRKETNLEIDQGLESNSLTCIITKVYLNISTKLCFFLEEVFPFTMSYF